MRKSIIYTLIFISSLIINNNLKAQDCNIYFPNEKGTVVETTSYTKKDKVTSVLKQTVLEKTQTAGVTTIKIKNEVTDEKSDVVNSSEYTIKCEGGQFYIDMESYLNQEQMSAYKGMQVDVDADDLTIPSNLQVGQKLNDGRVTAEIKNPAGIKMFTMNVDIKNRKVDAFEKITTSAGTFDCVKISYDMEMKMLFTIKASAIQWFAKDVGIVKQENYNKKGKLESYSLITKITK